MEKRLLHLAETTDLSTSSDIVSEVQSLKRELAEIYKEKANKAIFKARAKWTQLGEKPSAYFLGLEKRRAKEKHITALKDDKGDILTESQDILAYERKYFSDIYTEDPSQLSPTDDLEDMLNTEENILQITASHKFLNDLPFKPREFFTALKELNKNKSPGSDGITPEFYLTFWNTLQDHFYASFIHSLEQGTLSQEQRSGTLTLIPKKSQDRLHLNNWRPITLLNTDFKIISKAISNRLQMCIRDVVHTDQTGFIKGRTIGTNITSIQAVIDQTKATTSSGLLLAVDYRKAFDTIRWELIFLNALDSETLSLRW